MDTLNPQVDAPSQRTEKLEKLVAKQQKQLAEQADEIAFLKKENKRLFGELRKFLNENTPSGSIPPYIKPSLRREVEGATRERKGDAKPNLRNSRPDKHDVERDITLARCPCCGGTRITKNAIY